MRCIIPYHINSISSALAEVGVTSQLLVLETLARRTIVLLTFHKYLSLWGAQPRLCFLLMKIGPMRMHTQDNQRILGTPTPSSALYPGGFRYTCMVKAAPETCATLEARDFHLISCWTGDRLQDECFEDFKLNAPSTYMLCAQPSYCCTDSTAPCQNSIKIS